jgi:CMP-N-acetylneuraminic acid synthetase
VVVADVERLRAERNYYVYPLACYPMPWPAGLDIDTEEDLQYAEFLLESGRVPLFPQ